MATASTGHALHLVRGRHGRGHAGAVRLFHQGCHAGQPQPPATELRWPFSMRWLMVFWNWLYADQKPYQPVTDQSAEWNRGAYLVQGLGHCGECHTPRGQWWVAPKRLARAIRPFFQAARSTAGWRRRCATPKCRPLRSGPCPIGSTTSRPAAPPTAAFGPMVQVVQNSTWYMTEADLRAMATYIGSLGAPKGAAPAQAAPMAAAAEGRAASSPTAAALRAGGQPNCRPGPWCT